jgi:pyruvate dehydrogenase E2 component (dihydrolipoyllysine-residue acetyltransferase)
VTDILMPKLTDSMEEATILKWLVADGARVEPGDELVELETDKATVVHPAEAGGLVAIVAPEGTTLAAGELIARVGDQVASNGEAPLAVESRPARERPAVAATPVARRIAETHRLDLTAIEGTGPRGRITQRDVLAAAGEPVAEEDERRPLTSLQRVVARRMAESAATVPDFQVQTEVDMDAALALREQLKRAVGEGEAVPSITDLVVAAAARALREHPVANGSYAGGEIVLHDHVNVGVAVAAPGVLSVPVVRDADRKSLGAIAGETRVLAERVRSGEITPRELEGGTFTVSSLGMYGMTAITPVVNPPQAAILGVGAIRSVLARGEDGIVDRSLMTVTLSCDHRVLYGADAAEFLSAIRDRLESPLRLAL